jgi:hypothetical protein
MRKTRFVLAFGLLVGLVAGASLTATATDVTPERITGNVGGCPDGDLLKIDPVSGGTYAVDGGSITVVVNGSSFSWSTSGGLEVDEVFVKGGPDTNFYDYAGGSSGDTGLVAPTNPKNGQQPGLSHILFCGESKKGDGGKDHDGKE